jgi:hypothetical protein
MTLISEISSRNVFSYLSNIYLLSSYDVPVFVLGTKQWTGRIDKISTLKEITFQGGKQIIHVKIIVQCVARQCRGLVGIPLFHNYFAVEKLQEHILDTSKESIWWSFQLLRLSNSMSLDNTEITTGQEFGVSWDLPRSMLGQNST